MYEYTYSVNLGFQRVSGTFEGNKPMTNWERLWAVAAEVALSLIGK